MSPLRQTPTFNGDVRTLLLSSIVRNFDLDTSPELREFILASHLRLRLVDYFNESTTPLHRYYSILEVAVAARYLPSLLVSQIPSSLESNLHN